MNKIILSVLAIVLTLGAVSTSAYALFNSTATVSGLTFSTGNADLQVYASNSWTNDWNLSNSVFKNMYPNFTSYQQFQLKNGSTANITLDISAKLMDNPSIDQNSWNLLKDKIKIAFQAYDGSSWESSPIMTSYYPLSLWNNPGYSLGVSLLPNTSNYYRMLVKVDDATNEELAGKTISGITFQFTGLQH